MFRRVVWPAFATVWPLASTLSAQAVGADGRLSYPEGAVIPRSLTDVERDWLARHPRVAPLAVTPPPTGPVRCVAEYEPMDGILLAWEGPTTWNAIQTRMAAEITTFGNADVWVMVDTATEQTTAQSALATGGANLGRVRFLVQPTDTIWIRDYGPRYVYQGNCRAIVDHTYNRPRPSDDVLPRAFATARRHAFYEHALVHGGGNYHLDALGGGYATRLILNENPTLSEAQVLDTWRLYQNVVTTLFTPYPTTVDSTQHIDMWMQVIGDRAVVISDWPLAQGSVQDQICEAAATLMAGRGFTVHRVPAVTSGGTHYTFTNVVLCNGLVLVPSYTNATAAAYNTQAAAVWRSALPGSRVTQIDCQALVTSAGVMHCIVMHLPAHRGGLAPTAYLRNLNGGEALTPGANVVIEWISDDDQAVVGVDLLLSRNSGATFDEVIASGLPDSGTYTWPVPDVASQQARVRVVVRDAQGRTGHDDSDADFAILGATCSAAQATYGSGFGAGGAVPALSAVAPPRLGSAWALDLATARANQPAAIVLGARPLVLPLPTGGTLLVDPALVFAVSTDGSGRASLPIGIPAAANLCGAAVFWQAATPELALSAGLAARLGT